MKIQPSDVVKTADVRHFKATIQTYRRCLMMKRKTEVKSHKNHRHVTLPGLVLTCQQSRQTRLHVPPQAESPLLSNLLQYKITQHQAPYNLKFFPHIGCPSKESRIHLLWSATYEARKYPCCPLARRPNHQLSLSLYSTWMTSPRRMVSSSDLFAL